MEFSPEKFREARKQAKVSHDKVAQAIGVSRSTISHWEAGRAVPTQENLGLAAQYLGCSISAFEKKEDDIINQIRAVLRDADGRIKHETRFDSAGNPYREHWNLELTPALWKRMEKCMEQSGYVGNEVDAYLQSLIAEDYRKRFLVQTPENQLTEDSGKAN